MIARKISAAQTIRFLANLDLAVRSFFCEMPVSEHSPVARTPILDSGTLPLQRFEIQPWAIVVPSICAACIVVIQGIITPSGQSAILFPVAAFISILIHELGHLTAGWCVGFRFRSIAIGPFAIHLEHGKLRLRFRWPFITSSSGYAIMDVDTVLRLRRRLMLYIAAGPIANLITVPIALLFTNHRFSSFAALLTIISILMSVVNLLPLPVSPTLFTDGFRIATLLRDRERTRRLLSIYAVGAQRRNGKPPKTWKQTWLKAASSVGDDSVDDFWGNWLAYTSCIARNEGGSGAVHLERCLRLSGLLTETIRDLTAQQAVFFSAMYDKPLAQKWLKQTRRGNSRKIRFSEPPRKVQFPASAPRINIWSEST
jgi:Zn-dependent protease